MAQERHHPYHDPDEVRMTLGEHLEELRSRIVRAMIGLIAGAIVCYIFCDYVVGFLTWPMFAILRKYDLPATMTYLSPAEAFMTDLKVSFIVGFIITAPYALTQLWGFVAAGLYPNERRWVRRFAPVSMVLFYVGASFLLVIVAPLLLNFLVSYRQEFPDIEKYLPHWLVGYVTGEDTPAPTTQPTLVDWQDSAKLPIFKEDPPDVPVGAYWINESQKELRVRLDDGIQTVSHLTAVSRRNRVDPRPRISEYVIFILHLAAAFGIGFQVPVVVAFLASVGIASAAQMGKLRRYVWFGMAIASAVLTPPDINSMIFLLVPMAVLYEVGLIAARFLEKERAEAA